MTAQRRHRWAKRLNLAGLAVLGLSAVSIPVTIALALSASGTSDLLELGGSGSAATAPPAATVSAGRCVATRGYYALTFDGGPLAGTTPRLVAALRRAGAIATFFDTGARAAAHPELVALQRSAGQVAGGGYTGEPLTGLSAARRTQELQAAARVLGYPNAFVRPPGAADTAVEAAIRRSGLTSVYWTVDAWNARGVEPSGIVRIEETDGPALATLPALIRRLRADGLCPGRLARTRRTVLAATGVRFHVIAVKP